MDPNMMMFEADPALQMSASQTSAGMMGRPGPASFSVVSLAVAEIAIYAFWLTPTIWVTYRNGKSGLWTWPLILSFILTRIIANADLIAKRLRDEPFVPSLIEGLTTSGSIATSTLGIIGVLYMANVILLPRPRWTEKIILAATHVSTNIGVALASYGGAFNPETLRHTNPVVEQVGYGILLATLVYLGGWSVHTLIEVRHIFASAKRSAAIRLCIAGGVAVPVQMVRMGYGMANAATQAPMLDPVLGMFGVRLGFIFLTQLVVIVALLLGGVLAVDAEDRGDEEGLEWKG